MRKAGPVHDLWLAQSRLRRGHYDACLEACEALLAKNRHDMAAWFLKCRALTLKSWIDDFDIDEETEGDVMLDQNRVVRNPRPGTSLSRPLSRGTRPQSGFLRPRTAQRPITGARRLGTASLRDGGYRPGTASMVRVATASVRATALEDPFLYMGSIDVREFAKNPSLTKVLCDFYLFHEHEPEKALDLCMAVHQQSENADWWWMHRFGKCCYQLGMLQEAESHFKRALAEQSTNSSCVSDLAKIYIKQDQPNGALATYEAHSGDQEEPDVDCLLGRARIYELLGDDDAAFKAFKEVLRLDPSNVEALACLAAQAFSHEEVDLALAYYRRLLQMGIHSVEVWNNLGLCCLHTERYDIATQCFHQALKLIKDGNAADVWYNIGHLGIAIGELDMAEYAFSVAVFVDSTHGEALNNLGVLKALKERDNEAKTCFENSRNAQNTIFQPIFNAAVLAMKQGNVEESFNLLQHFLELQSDHQPAKIILNQLRKQL